MTSRRKSMEDELVDACISIQIEFNELDVDKLLNMPSTRFNLLIEKISEIKERTPQTPRERKVDVFGIH